MKVHNYTLPLPVIVTIGMILMQSLVAQIAFAVQKTPVTIHQIMTHLSFDKSNKQALLDGNILSTGMPEMEQLRDELSVAAVMLVVKAPIQKVIDAYLNETSFRQNCDILAYKMIQSTSNRNSLTLEEDFRPAGFTKNELSEIQKLISYKGGYGFNFSQDELKRLQAIDSKDPAVAEKIALIIRQILMQRYQSYFKEGLEGIQPYDRDRGKHSLPRRELTVAVGSIKLLENHFPDFYQSLLKYPEEGGKVKHEFYWFKNRIDNRPVFQLSHYMSDIHGHYAIVAELQFYVEHSYNSMLTIIGCVPYESGSVVFCVNRTFTDQVDGFGSSLKRKVGRRRMEDAISEHFAKLRSMLEVESDN